MVPVQVPVNPEWKVTVGVAGMVKAGLNVTAMVLGEARAPPDEVVKPTVQVETAPATDEPGAKVTPESGVAPITIGEAGLAGVGSADVATLKVLAG